MSEENKLAEVNATLDRFAKLIEENARQLAEDRKEAKRLRAEDLARERAKDEKRRVEEEKRRAEEEKQRAEEAKQRAEDREEAKRQRAEDLANDKKRQEEWEQRQAEWDKRFANMCDQVGGQGSTIGEITEAMTVSDNIIGLVNEFEGIEVTNFAFNIRKKYKSSDSNGNSIRKQHEVDGLADGKKVAVVIEAKTTLTNDYVEYFVTKLANFKVAYPEHSHKDVYGAVTFIRADDRALALAERHGLFIIKTSPPDVKLVNNEGFKPTKIK